MQFTKLKIKFLNAQEETPMKQNRYECPQEKGCVIPLGFKFFYFHCLLKILEAFMPAFGTFLHQAPGKFKTVPLPHPQLSEKQ